MSPSQTRSKQTKIVTTVVLLNKNSSKWQQPLSKESKRCKEAKPVSKENPLRPAKPPQSSKQLSHSLPLLRREFTALQDIWNYLYTLMLSPTAFKAFMTRLPNWSQSHSPAQDMIPPPLLPLPALPQTSWNYFLYRQDIGLSTGHHQQKNCPAPCCILFAPSAGRSRRL